jgi:hypothetical protein
MADALRDKNITPCFLGYREGDVFWLHGVHRSRIPDVPELFDQQSPYGYGGPLSNSDSPDFVTRAWNAYTELCRTEGVLAEFVRLHPLMEVPTLYGGITKEDRDTVVVDIRKYEDLRAGYSTRCRTAIRKALNEGLVVKTAERSAISRYFGNFYRSGMRAIGASDFYFFDDRYFEAFESWGNVELLVCEQEGEWLSAGLFLRSGRVMEYHLSATTISGRNCGATNLLLDAAAHRACEHGCSYLYLGGGTDNLPDNPLFFFKQSFSKDSRPFFIGFTAFLMERYDNLRREYTRQGKPVSRFLFYR